jgi:hypothetical protein
MQEEATEESGGALANAKHASLDLDNATQYLPASPDALTVVLEGARQVVGLSGSKCDAVMQLLGTGLRNLHPILGGHLTLRLANGGKFSLVFVRTDGNTVGVLVKQLEPGINAVQRHLTLEFPSVEHGLDLRREALDQLVDILPRAEWVPLTAEQHEEFKRIREAQPRQLADHIEVLLNHSELPHARDGRYQATLMQGYRSGDLEPTLGLLVKYTPREAQPLLPETLDIVEQLIPRAFRVPKYKAPPRPSKKRAPALPGFLPLDLSSDLADLGVPGDVYEEVSNHPQSEQWRQEVDRRIAEQGSEALACYGSYHNWDRSSWGIVIDDLSVVMTAMTLSQKLRSVGVENFQFALKAILWLVWEHEFFHARVDAFALLQEAAGRRPLYRRYQSKVYRPTARGSSGALEEALANFSAREAVRRRLDEHVNSGGLKNEARTIIMSFIDDLFDASPPGYRDWRMGADHLKWRALAAQVLSGRADPGSGILPPVEGLLRNLPGMLFRTSDVPVFITTFTQLGRTLFSPARREAERILRHFGCAKDESGGKGSHEKWTRPGATRPWTMPTRDPMSKHVFGTMLDFLNIGKEKYMELRRSV